MCGANFAKNIFHVADPRDSGFPLNRGKTKRENAIYIWYGHTLLFLLLNSNSKCIILSFFSLWSLKIESKLNFLHLCKLLICCLLPDIYYLLNLLVFCLLKMQIKLFLVSAEWFGVDKVKVLNNLDRFAKQNSTFLSILLRKKNMFFDHLSLNMTGRALLTAWQNHDLSFNWLIKCVTKKKSNKSLYIHF